MKRYQQILLLIAALTVLAFAQKSGQSGLSGQGGGNTTAPFRNGAVTSTVAVKASAGVLYGYYIYNPNSTVCSEDIFNTPSGSVTLGTTAPYLSLVIPATAGANLVIPPQVFSSAISTAAVTAAGGATPCSTGMTVNLFYQ